jgi:adenosylhomocysteine nucleosidase
MTVRLLLGIVAACEPEATLVRRHLYLQYTQATPAGRLWRGETHGQDTVLLRSGMGAERATGAATWLTQHYPLHGLLSIGFAGGLQASLATGDTLLPQHVLNLSSDTPRDISAHMPAMPTDTGLARLATIAANQAQLRQHCGTLLSVPEVLTDATVKHHLGQRSGALAVDMESYSIGQVAVAHGLPFMTLRTIFDTCDEAIPFQAEHFTAVDGAVQPGHALYYLVSHPRTLLHIVPTWRKVRRAGCSLQAWLHHFLPLLSQQRQSRENLQCLP